MIADMHNHSPQNNFEFGNSKIDMPIVEKSGSKYLASRYVPKHATIEFATSFDDGIHFIQFFPLTPGDTGARF